MVGLEELKAFMQKQLEEDKQKKYVNVSGDTLEEALNEASIELSLPVKKIEYEVLEQGNKGVFGFAKKRFLVLAYPAIEDEVDQISREDMDFGFDIDQDANRDGEVFVRLSPNGVLLKVTEPKGSGRRITETDAVAAINRRVSIDFDKSMVQKVVKQADGEFFPIGRYEYDPSNDAALTVSIADSEMKAYITAVPPGSGGADPEYDTIIGFLQDNGVTDGYIDEVIKRFVDDPVYREPVLVAEGIKPENGADARIVMNFETDAGKIRLKETDGKVNFKELNIVQNVVEGQVLARKIPAERGKPGRTVTGKLLPAKDGADTKIQIGKNARLSEDGRSALAEINGQVVLSSGKINVEPVYLVAGNVNLKTGNILFLGTVIIKGNVDDGFDVKASGNIEVMGGVGKSTLDAEGDIIVHQGVAGKTTGSIRCGGNLWSKFLENVEVDVSGLVVVSDGIINSHVICQKKVICRGKRASIVGGQTRAVEEVNAKTLGSVAGMETIIEVGHDPKSKEKLNALEERKRELTKELDEVQLNMTTIETLKKKGKKLTKEKVMYYKELKQKKQELHQELLSVSTEMEEIQNYLAQLKTTGKISASGVVFPGVKLSIKDAFLNVKNEFKAVTFISEANSVKVTKYEESDEDISTGRRD